MQWDVYRPGAGLPDGSGRPASPPPEHVRHIRLAARLTQRQAGRLVHLSLRTWQRIEYGSNPIHPGLWELFCRKLAER
jgi:DNA-binding XRE family transcriptional regulator